jgi:hypothetical protein
MTTANGFTCADGSNTTTPATRTRPCRIARRAFMKSPRCPATTPSSRALHRRIGIRRRSLRHRPRQRLRHRRPRTPDRRQLQKRTEIHPRLHAQHLEPRQRLRIAPPQRRPRTRHQRHQQHHHVVLSHAPQHALTVRQKGVCSDADVRGPHSALSAGTPRQGVAGVVPLQPRGRRSRHAREPVGSASRTDGVRLDPCLRYP